ncbi:MAG: hypothetical protein KDH96_10435, partial [Candidatus Riesia sp.]|nr:hypothetical protein [Candidatus Riesia sp.]
MITMEENKAWQEYVQVVSEMVETRETYQRKLGQISATVQELFGSNALAGFAEDIKESTGRSVSPKTLRNYAWVWKKIGNLELPEDITYRALQAIASTEDPDKWAHLLMDEG